MENKDDKYFVKISAKFLLGIKFGNTSEYLDWIFVYIKLMYNYYLQHNPNNHFELKVNDISSFFNLHKVTVYDCLKWLTEYGLLEKEGRGKYKIIDEKRFIETYVKNTNSKDPFLPIYRNFFIDLWSSRIKAVDANVYYFLVNGNGHHTIKEDKWLEVKTKQSQACRYLGIDYRTYKKSIKKLLELGYLRKDGEGILFTRAPKPKSLLKEDSTVREDSIEREESIAQEDTTAREESDVEMDLDTPIEEKLDAQMIKDLEIKMKVDLRLISTEKKKELLEKVMYDVNEWMIHTDKNHVVPFVKHPLYGEHYYYEPYRIPMDKCEVYGIDVSKCREYKYGC
ncbi:hypothetical protein ACFLSV_07715 [Bacteroidota bacterium]